jgi:hypothetical protein
MNIRLPQPQTWQDFESICHHLWKEIWNDPNAQKNGRQGQAQNGVDIFGTPIYSNEFSGVQCKDKDGLLGSKLKAAELNNECKKAMNFLPKISSFSLATSAARDAVIQKSARQLTDKKKYPFSVQVWSWDDIQSEIAYRPAILNHYYPGYTLSTDEQLMVNLNRYSPRDLFYAYFTRPSVKNLISTSLKDSLITLAYELSDNSYVHGKATEFIIKVEPQKISFIDNGIQFNPIVELNPMLTCDKSNVGSYVFDNFIKKYSGAITPNYIRKTENNIELNILEFEISGDLLPFEKKDFIEIYINLNEATGRNAARQKADLLSITPDLKEVIVTVTYNIAMSYSIEFIRVLLERLTKDQKLILSVPRHGYFDDTNSWFNDERLIVKKR